MPQSAWQVAPVLGVARVRPAAEHYRDVLGFRLDPRTGVFAPSPAEPDGVYAIVERGLVRVHLQIRRGRAVHPAERPPFERDAYFFVDDVDALHAEFVRRGARILVPPGMAPHGIHEMVVADLDGHRLAFGAR